MKRKVSILLVCAGGNSTSILVLNMQKNLNPEENWHIGKRYIICTCK